MRQIITEIWKYLFPGHTHPLYETLSELRATVLEIKERVAGKADVGKADAVAGGPPPPVLLSTILNPGEKVFHMLRTAEDREHVAAAVWSDPAHKLTLVSEDIEAQTEFDSLSAFGEHHYKMVANNRKTTFCRGYKECYVVRDGKRYQLYELLP